MTKNRWKSAIGAGFDAAAADWSDGTSSSAPLMTPVDAEATGSKSKTEVRWKKAVSADFNTAADWSTGTVPGASDDAILNAKKAAFDVTASTSETVKSIQLASNATLDVEARTFTATAGTGSGANAGLIRIDDNAFFAVGGGVKNTGTIALDSSGSQTALILDANTTFSGGGQVTLSDNSNNLVEGAAAGDTLTNVDNTISGAGQLGAGRMTLINEAKGVIDATGTNALVLDTSGETASNAGLIEATGTGGLLLQSTTVANGAKGVIEANGAGSHVDLGTAVIEGGILKTANGGVIQAVDRGSVLDGMVDAVKVAGTVDIVNGTAAYLYLEGTIDNTGTINIQSAGNDVRLRMNANTLLTGTGSVVMSDNTNNTIDAGTAGASLTNVSNTISGAGTIGGNGLVLINDAKGVIDATGGNALIVETYGTITNLGLLEATGAGGLLLQSNTIDDSSGGIILAANGSNVALHSDMIIGGLLESVGTGVITQDDRSTTLDGITSAVTLKGTLDIVNPTSAWLYVEGTIDNTGTINIQSAGDDVRLRMNAATTLTGGGTIVMSDNPNNTIDAGTAGASLTNVSNTISGAGVIGGNGLVLINEAAGVIDATGTNALTLNTGNTVTNNGLIEATGSGGLLIANTTVNDTTGGTILAGAASTVTLSGAGVIGGVLETRGSGVIAVQGAGATLDGTGSQVVNQGLLAVQASSLTLEGAIDNSGTIAITVGFHANGNLIVGSAGATLSGGGSVTLASGGGNYGAAQIYGATAADVLTNFSDTITGNGAIGNGQLTLINDAAGVIDATVGITLNTGANSIANAGTLEATGGGTLAIRSAVDNSSSGIILAGAGSTVGVYGVHIVGGTVLATNTSSLDLSYANLTGGTIQSQAGGVIDVLAGGGSTFSYASVANQGEIAITVGFQSDATLSLFDVSIDNTGTIALTSGGGSNANAYLGITGTVTLSGGGVVSLAQGGGRYPGTPEINGYGALTNIDNTIYGAGVVDPGALINEAAGVIDATGGLTLNSGVHTVTNAGLIEATNGGTLSIQGQVNSSAGGTILAADTSTVFLQGADIVGGDLQTMGNGVIDVLAGPGSELDGTASPVTNQGLLTVVAAFDDAAALNLLGTIDNTGTIIVAANDGSNSNAYLNILDAVTLRGLGEVVLDQGTGRYPGTAEMGGVGTFTNFDNTIEGSGILAPGNFINDAAGVVDATGNLTFNGPSVTNMGTLEVSGGTLSIASYLNGAGGTIFAGSGTNVLLQNATGSDGTLDTAAGGTITLANGSTATVAGVANAGTILVDSTGAVTTLAFAKNTSLTGGGVFELSADADNVVEGTKSGVILTNVDNTIEGSGKLGNRKMTLVNDAGATIDADGAAALTIDTGSASIINAGLIEATDNAKGTIASAVNNTGTLEANGGTLTLQAAVTGAGAVDVASGTLDIANAGAAENVAFTGKTGKLELDQSRSYTGVVSGFSTAGKTSLDLRDIGFTGANEASFSGTAKGGVLTVSDGTHTANISLSGDFLNATFVASSDGHAGVSIVDAPSQQAPIHAMVSAMAAMGGSAAAPAYAADQTHLATIGVLSAPRVVDR